MNRLAALLVLIALSMGFALPLNAAQRSGTIEPQLL